MGGFFDDVLGLDDSGGLKGFADNQLGIDDSGGLKGFAENPLNIFFPFSGAGLYGALKPDIPSINTDVARLQGTLLTRTGAVQPLPVPYGVDRAGGIRVLEVVTGANNEYLHHVYVWGDGEIEAIDAVYIDDIISTDAKYAGLVRINHHTGSDSQTADTDLVAEVAAWTSAHRGRGIPYTYIRFKWDANVWRGRPRVQADLRGRQVYDPRENRLTYSEQFDNAAWVKLNATVSANATIAPNGTLTADKLIASAGAAEHAISENFTFLAGVAYAFSFYAKAAEYQFGLFSARSNGVDNGCWIDLTTGATSNAFGVVTVSTEDAGDGWWRVKAIVPVGTGVAAYARVNAATAAGVYSFAGDGVSGIYIFGVQLNSSGAVKPYVRTTSAAIVPGTRYSSNPALCIRDYLTSARYGLGASTADVDDDAIIDAATYCEIQREQYNGAGIFHNLYSCDGAVDTARPVRDNIIELLTCCRGFISTTGGKYTLILDKPAAATFTFDIDNIVGEWGIEFSSKRDRCNRVSASFSNPALDYEPDVAPCDSPTFLAADNYRLLDRRLTLPYTKNWYRARDLCELELKQSRQGLVVRFTATLAALQCGIGDVVNITHPTPAWTAKTFRLLTLDLQNDGTVRVTAREHEPTVYDLALPTAAPTPADTGLPDPTVVVPPSALVLDGGTNGLMRLGDGTNLARIKCNITATTDIYAVGYQFELKESLSSDWVVGTVTQSRSSTEAYLFPVRDLVAYDVRVCAVNTMSYKSPYIQQLNYTVLGEEQPPSDVASAWIEIDGDRARLKWSQVADVDVNEYEVRRGTVWATATFVFRGSAENTLLTALPAGLNTYLVKAIDRRKKYSTNAATATFTTVVPTVSSPIAQVIDNNVLLKWTATPGSLPIRRYNVRRGAVFASPDRDFGAVDSTFAVVFEDASGNYTYWVQPVDVADNAGTAVAVTAAVSQPPDYVLRSDQNSAFGGTKTSAVVLASGALLLPVTTTETWAQHFSNGGWSNIQAQISAGYPIYAEPSAATGSYQEVIDYGTTLPATKITITPTTTQIHGTNTLTPTLETAPDSGGSPGAWTSYGSVWEAFAAGGFRFVRVTIATTSSGGDDLVRIDSLNVKASLKLKSDAGMGTAAAADAGGTTVTFGAAFLDVSSITVTPSGTVARYAIYDFVDAPNPTQFKVLLFDAAGARVSGGFSWTSRGN